MLVTFVIVIERMVLVLGELQVSRLYNNATLSALKLSLPDVSAITMQLERMRSQSGVSRSLGNHCREHVTQDGRLASPSTLSLRSISALIVKGVGTMLVMQVCLQVC